MAYIYKRGKTYSYSVEIGRSRDGKRLKETRGGFRTKKEAQQAAVSTETEIANGTHVTEKEILFSDYADIWYEEHKKFIKISTAYRMKSQLQFIKEFFKNEKLKNITRLKFQSFLDFLSSDNQYQYETTKNIRTIAKMIFDAACKYDIIKKNPSEYTLLPMEKNDIVSLDDALPKYMEKEVLHKFLETIRLDPTTESAYPLFLTLAYTGLRLSEATALLWSDINFEEKTLSVSKNLYFINKKRCDYIFQPPKTKSSVRKIPISDTLISMLKEHCKKQKEEKILHRNMWEVTDDFIFTRSYFSNRRLYGSPFPNSDIRYRTHKTIERLGLNGITTHSLRHTHVSLLAEAGVPLEVIQERLGHKSDNTTRQIYLHITKSLKTEAAQKFEKLMNNL